MPTEAFHMTPQRKVRPGHESRVFWRVWKAGADRASIARAEYDDAIIYCFKKASTIYIHNYDGTIRERWTKS